MKSGFNKQKVYEILTRVPSGKVITYGQIAEMLGNKHLAQSIGNALHANPDGEKYPCYKVVNSQGKLSSNYAFGGIEEQKHRLEADGIKVKNNKVDLNVFGMELLNDMTRFFSV